MNKIINHPEPILCNKLPIKIRKYLSLDKRIIVSKVGPLIPHDIIIGKLSKIIFNPANHIICFRVDFLTEGFNNILSF